MPCSKEQENTAKLLKQEMITEHDNNKHYILKTIGHHKLTTETLQNLLVSVGGEMNVPSSAN